MTLRDIAWAKVNLTLRVLGRRADGFHEIESLVAFAGIGDTVELVPQSGLGLSAEGPFAAALSSDNLILAAAEGAKALMPGLTLGRFRLVKNLPVAAGLGGGSADAAAALRLIAKTNPGTFAYADTARLAPRLGSDVAVCLASAPALIIGRGEIVRPVRGFPSCGVLLANPGLPLATADVYGALHAPPLASPPSPAAPPDFGGTFGKLLDHAGPRGNDLESAATRLAPEIADVLVSLHALPGAQLARLSGSGPTCFALFATALEAHRAAEMLAQARPNWWIAASEFGDPAAQMPAPSRQNV